MLNRRLLATIGQVVLLIITDSQTNIHFALNYVVAQQIQWSFIHGIGLRGILLNTNLDTIL